MSAGEKQREFVVLVDEDDVEVGTMEKLEAHERGSLHRAFSVFIFTGRGELILQRRAAGKYHSAGLWTNTCCGHPRPGEDLLAAATRRLKEEMGITCELHHRFRFTYSTEVGSGLRENELDHVFIGICNDVPTPDLAEADAWRTVSLSDLQTELMAKPSAFTPWLHVCFPRVHGLGRDLVT